MAFLKKCFSSATVACRSCSDSQPVIMHYSVAEFFYARSKPETECCKLCRYRLSAGNRCRRGVDHYTIDPNHTYPSFKHRIRPAFPLARQIDRSSGTVTLDRAAKTAA